MEIRAAKANISAERLGQYSSIFQRHSNYGTRYVMLCSHFKEKYQGLDFASFSYF